MDAWVSWFQSEEGMGLTLALIIFFATILMAAKRWVGLISTIVLMTLSIAIGWAVANPGKVQELMTTSYQTEK